MVSRAYMLYPLPTQPQKPRVIGEKKATIARGMEVRRAFCSRPPGAPWPREKRCARLTAPALVQGWGRGLPQIRGSITFHPFCRAPGAQVQHREAKKRIPCKISLTGPRHPS